MTHPIFVKHPLEASLINVSIYADIRCDNIETVKVNFYLSPRPVYPPFQPLDTRQPADFFVEFADMKDRDRWFNSLFNILTDISVNRN